ncbi:MAG: c(7)-type cytochrome triheme domain-containing protein [Nitrospirota bacterium]
MTRLFLILGALFIFAGTAYAKRVENPEEYGRVIIKNYSKAKNVPPVVFDHWLHRSMYTCRLCHVDIGFAMEAGATNITAETNSKGFYCGSCHDGKRKRQDRTIFAACSDQFAIEEGKRCDRCHSVGVNVKKEYLFSVFTKGFPRKGLGDGIDWEEAEAKGFISPVDYLEGISIKKPALKPQEDFAIESRASWMSEVIFSHKKHALWNGCEVCHPEIFPSVKKGDVSYTMLDIFDGQYCGVCHDKVAFSLYDCQRCHTKPVEGGYTP